MLDEDEQPSGDTEDAIRRDARLTDAQKDALITVYRSFLPTAQ